MGASREPAHRIAGIARSVAVGLTLAIGVSTAAARPLPDECDPPATKMAEVLEAVTDAAEWAPLTDAAVESNPPLDDDVAILVGGIDARSRDLDGWGPIHAAAGLHVLDFPYDRRRKTLTENAAILRAALLALNAAGVKRVTINAYSMGGLVTKAALDSMAADGTLSRFEHVDFTARGTPWGGYNSANIAWNTRYLLGTRWISRWIGKPMALEMGSKTPFIRARGAPLPDNVSFHLVEGEADDIGGPQHEREKANYRSVQVIADDVTVIGGADHAAVARPRRP